MRISTTTRIALTCGLLGIGTGASTQTQGEAPERRPSPPGASSTQVGGLYDERAGYVGGHWIEIRYGRPIKRGRDLFGPSDYVDFLNDGATVWRAGANLTTRLITEVSLTFDGQQVVPPGEHTVFIELATDPWTFIVSTWPAQSSYDDKDQDALFGAYDYTPDQDIVRAPMTRETLSSSFDQLSWQFLDMDATGGRLALFWDTTMASVPFAISE